MKTFSVLLICEPKQRKGIGFADFDIPELLSVEFNSENLKNIGKQLSTTDLVVTCGDWNNCETCDKSVRIARLMDIEVIHHTRYRDYVEQKYNR